ncbi:MAG TPA: prolyl oligopeptidase family serine peptidase [Acidobacteriota bacterium]|nr:prolyl oligopeptidase family serine peptidase [Acidobacteriota bacterium]
MYRFYRFIVSSNEPVGQPEVRRGAPPGGTAFRPRPRAPPGRGPGRDVISGIAEILQRPYVDKKRQAVTGWSYGGYMTTWLLENYPDEWRALL